MSVDTRTAEDRLVHTLRAAAKAVPDAPPIVTTTPETTSSPRRGRRKVAALVAAAFVVLCGVALLIVVNAGTPTTPSRQRIIEPTVPTTVPSPPPRLVPPQGATVYGTDVQTGPVPNQPIQQLWGYLGPGLEQPPLLLVYLMDYRSVGGVTLEQRGCTSGTPGPQTSGRIIDLDGLKACLAHPIANGAFVNWEVAPGVVIDVRAEGLSDEQLLGIVRSVRVNDDLAGIEIPEQLADGLDLYGGGPVTYDTERVSTQFADGNCEYVLSVQQTSPAEIVSLMTGGNRRRTTVNGVPAVLNSSMIGWSPQPGTTVTLNMQPITRQERCADPPLVDVAQRVQAVDDGAWQQFLVDLGDAVIHSDRSGPAPR